MSRCLLFIHDFFRDGREDLLAEVSVLQAYGQWTKEKRARWTKLAVTNYERFKHAHFSVPQSASYYAGRITGLKSAVTARYPAKQESHGKMVFLSIENKRSVFCGSCGDKATWKYHECGNPSSIRYRCDCCKQEVVRVQTAYTTLSGWDWNDDEIELFPQPPRTGKKSVTGGPCERLGIFFPSATTISIGFIDLLLHIPISLFVLQAVLILHLALSSEETGKMKGEDA